MTAAMVLAGIGGMACSKSSGSTAQIQSDGAIPAADGLEPDTASLVDVDTLAGLPAPSSITLTTLAKTPLVIEGLTADALGNLYAAGRGGNPCLVWRFAASPGTPVVVGNIAAPCSPNGLAFNGAGDLFVGDGDKIYRLTPSEQSPPTATVFASGVPGANGIAFDRAGKLWASDGTTGQGRVWSIDGSGSATEVFRVQPLASDVNVVTAGADGGSDAGAAAPDAGVPPSVGGIGRDVRALPPGSLTITAATRAAADTAGSLIVVANGLAFAADGSLLVADTTRGAIWKVTFDAQGALASPVGCDTAFVSDTLCLENIFVAHPILEGVDGIALDVAGNIWGTANERNAIAVVTPAGKVREVFRNPPDAASRLRNGGPLEYPTSPFLAGKKLCITQSDTSRRDNFPSSGGEVGPGLAGPVLGKLSCMDQPVPSAGLALPVH